LVVKKPFLSYHEPMKLKAVVAGQFYPGKREELRAVLDGYAPGKPSPGPDPVAFLLPHAGYPYSGAVAALGYRSLSKVPRTVVVAGPSHYLPFRGVSLFAGEAVVTPLGDLPVDQEACRALMEADPYIAEIPAAFAREHSVEVHLPMVQRYLPGAKVVPIVMGQGSAQAVEPLTRALLGLWEERPFLFVASSDLSHYPSYEVAREADGEFLKALLTGDPDLVAKTDARIMRRGHDDYHCTHCGKEPVSTLLGFVQGVGAGKARLLEYRNSGDVTGDRSHVVGYAAVAFSK
jgi:AmmeMemoRadiSam system protein B